ncbi:hypothetical protein CMI37_11960 [Candidatus Pacearchaeota archaeon]|nr:hypothetical protein [Candidatus Pacearchaeota archaeon]
MIRSDEVRMAERRNIRNKTVIGVIGIILVIFGIIWTIPLALKGVPYVYGLFGTSFLVVLGVILISWAFSD